MWMRVNILGYVILDERDGTFSGILIFNSFRSFIAFGSFTVHTGAGLIVPEIQDDGKVFYRTKVFMCCILVLNRHSF